MQQCSPTSEVSALLLAVPLMFRSETTDGPGSSPGCVADRSMDARLPEMPACKLVVTAIELAVDREVRGKLANPGRENCGGLAITAGEEPSMDLRALKARCEGLSAALSEVRGLEGQLCMRCGVATWAGEEAPRVPVRRARCEGLSAVCGLEGQLAMRRAVATWAGEDT